MSSFGEFLYSLRKEKGMTQAELAEALGVTNKAVSKWETGEAMPETGLLLPLSRIFGVTVDELLEGKRTEESAGEKQASAEADEKPCGGCCKPQDKSFADILCGLVCAAVFLSGVAAYLIIGACYEMWTPYWVIIPCSALLCGIVGLIFELFNPKKREQKKARGENFVTGAICGFVMLSCLIAYLLCGALGGLWHPHWIIVVAGVIFCALTGTIGELITHKNKENGKTKK